jgi:hypothetical protein
MEKALQALVLNLIVMAVFGALVALAIIAIQSAAADEGDAPMSQHIVMQVPPGQAKGLIESRPFRFTLLA